MSNSYIMLSPFRFVLSSLGRTQPPHITDIYKSYFKDTTFAYISYTVLSVYFLHKFLNAYHTPVSLMKTQAISTLESQQSSLESKKIDTKAEKLTMVASGAAAVASMNWSFAPFYPMPHFITIAVCIAAEAAIYSSANHKNIRQNYEFEAKDHKDFGKRFCKFMYRIPLVNYCLKITNTEKYMPHSKTQINIT